MPLVAIAGRPNVGKSTLFNALVRRSAAITSSVPGTTRDWLEGDMEAGGGRIRIADTCGWGSEGELGRLMDAGLGEMLRSTSMTVMVVDAHAPLQEDELRLANMLRRLGTPALLVLNKCDSPEDDATAWEFSRLGLGAPLPVSAMRHRNLGELRRRIASGLSPDSAATGGEGASPGQAAPRCVLLGQPNVGKSSLFNAILQKPRSLVHAAPGTTRDPVSAMLDLDGRDWELVDTAGVSARWKHSRSRGAPEGDAAEDRQPGNDAGKDAIMRAAQGRSIRSLEGADVVVLLLDVTCPLARQDLRLAQTATRGGAALAVALNKCDLLTDARRRGLRREASEYLVGRFPELGRFPMVFSSAVTGMGLESLAAAVTALSAMRRTRLSPQALADAAYDWPSSGRPWRLRQTGAAPLVFSAAPPPGNKLGPRFVSNRLREAFGLHGVPIFIQFSGGGAAAGRRAEKR